MQPYARALRGWRDVTRDAGHEPRAAQFRIDLRSAAGWLSARVPQRIAAPVENALAVGTGFILRACELMVLTLALQIGMLPLMARDFHRIPLAAPFANLAAVPLTGIVVKAWKSAAFFPACQMRVHSLERAQAPDHNKNQEQQ